jgi:hypothetical protein
MFKALFQFLFGSKKKKTDPMAAQNDMVYEVRNQFEKGLRETLKKAHGDKSKQIAEIATNYVFDFGEFGFDFSEGKDLKKIVGAELVNICNYDIADPLKLLRAMVHRALQLKKTGQIYEDHMRDLWILCLVPVGPLTPPDSFFPSTAGHMNFVKRLRLVEITDRQAENAQRVWKDPHLKAILEAWLTAHHD